ncbi:MAG: hypothetical protein EAZ52_03780 [Alphaproteobacteria bacterium]|nr:MAG: hypothetical protein EAZ66_02505 [Alphaproteobacteria bacterium]TAF76650.1 MAG: hypothetical protein EAZ52_03780 [Alphaproteobacteria bacterium]
MKCVAHKTHTRLLSCACHPACGIKRFVGGGIINHGIIIPAHAARPLSTSPVHMMRMSFYLGSLALVLGVCFSVYVIDAPLAAMIIVMNAILCLVTVRFTRRDAL